MDKLIVPASCHIRGEVESITNPGDIVIEGPIQPRSLNSEAGGIKYVSQQENGTFQDISAPSGLIELQGKDLQGERVQGQSVQILVDRLTVANLEAAEMITIQANEVSLDQCRGGELEIKTDHYQGSRIEVDGELTLRANLAIIHEIRAKRVIVRGSLECRHLIATESVVVESGNVAIKKLESPSFHASPEVTGIVAIATCEEVRAEGVRGFLRPGELDMFTADGGPIPTQELMHEAAAAGPPAGDSVPEPEPAPPRETSFAVVEPEPEAAEVSTLDEPPESLDDAVADNPETMTVSLPEAPVETLPVDEAEDDASDGLETLGPPDLEDAEGETMPTMSEDLAETPLQTERDDAEPMEQTGEAEIDAAALSSQDWEIVDQDDDVTDDQLEPPTLADDDADFIDGGGFEALDPVALADDDTDLADDGVFDDLGDGEEAFDDADVLEELPELEAADLEEAADPLGSESMEILDGDDLLDDPADSNNGEDTAPDIDDDVLARAIDDGLDADEVDDDDIPSVEFDDEDLEDLNDVDVMEEEDAEDVMIRELRVILDQIQAYFPEDNFPQFINQIRRYLDERRFSLFSKENNRKAVLSSFDKFEHQEISALARAFFDRLLRHFDED